MFSSVKEFLAVWDMETTATLSCFEKLTDASFSAEPVAGYRSIGRLVNHIADSAISIPHEAGVAVAYEKEKYHTVDELIKAYTTATNKVKAAIATLTDDALQNDVPMYGETWKRGFALWVTVVHQVHHRGQLTVLMRAAGLKVPGIYGPCKEEWEAIGLPQAD